MKTFTRCTVLTLVYLLGAHSIAAQIDLAGSWNCQCVIEEEGTSITFNDFCAYELKGAQVDITGRELVITDMYIETIENGETIQIPYTFDREDDILSFTFNDTELRFKVLMVTGGTRLILRDFEGGSLLFLEQK